MSEEASVRLSERAPSVRELPTIPPMMECVVDIGHPREVATVSQSAAESKADYMI